MKGIYEARIRNKKGGIKRFVSVGLLIATISVPGTVFAGEIGEFSFSEIPKTNLEGISPYLSKEGMIERKNPLSKELLEEYIESLGELTKENDMPSVIEAVSVLRWSGIPAKITEATTDTEFLYYVEYLKNNSWVKVNQPSCNILEINCY